MHGFILSERNVKRYGEQGYLLATAGTMVLVLVALLSSFIFVVKRDSNYKANYAAGERFAELTAMSHFYAQQQYFATRNNVPRDQTLNCNGGDRYLSSVTGDLFVPMAPPDNFRINPIAQTEFNIEIREKDLAPVSSPAPCSIKAPSAYVLIRFTGTRQTPTDRVAFLAGAAKRGMGRVGTVGSGFAAGDICDGAATRVRWGPEASACLNQTHINQIFPTSAALIQNGDIIVPSWETALARSSQQIIYRFPQPERPDLNSMRDVALQFTNSSSIESANEVRGDTLRQTVAASGANNDAITNLSVRNGRTSTFNERVTFDNPTDPDERMHVYNRDIPVTDNANGIGTAPVMTVTGGAATPIDFNNSTLNIAETLTYDASQTLEVILTRNDGLLMTDHIGVAPGNTPIATTQIELADLRPGSEPLEAAFDDPEGAAATPLNIGNLGTTAGQRINIAGVLNTVSSTNAWSIAPEPTTPGSRLNVYAAEIVMPQASTATITNITTSNPTDSLDWTVGAINQQGNQENATRNRRLVITNELVVDDGVIDYDDCIGRACPNYKKDPDPGGI